MSCGNHDTDCAEALLRAFEYLDGELDPAEGERIRAHLERCAPCLQEYDLDRIMKALVRRSCQMEHAPAELRTQIIARITTMRTSAGGTTTTTTTVRVSGTGQLPG